MARRVGVLSPLSRFALLGCVCACLSVAVGGCGAKRAGDRDGASSALPEPPQRPGPLARLFKKKEPPPRFDQLDSTRYLGAPESTPPVPAGLPDAALLQAAALEPSGGVAHDGSGAVADPSWRPEWWSDQPVREPGTSTVSVCALGEAKDLLTARRTALELAREVLKSQLAGARLPDSPGTRADSVKMPDGRYRAFVRLTAPVR